MWSKLARVTLCVVVAGQRHHICGYSLSETISYLVIANQEQHVCGYSWPRTLYVVKAGQEHLVCD